MAQSSGTRIIWYPLGIKVKSPHASRAPDLSKTKSLSLAIILPTCKDLQYRILDRVPTCRGPDLQGHQKEQESCGCIFFLQSREGLDFWLVLGLTPNIWLNRVCYEIWPTEFLNFKTGLVFTNSIFMGFSLEARGCQTQVWTLYYLGWIDRLCVEEMNNKHCVLWDSNKGNNKLASVMVPIKGGLLQATARIEPVASSQPLKRSNFLFLPHPVRESFAGHQ